MTVKDLMDFLKNVKPDMPVILAGGLLTEGSDYDILAMAQEVEYVPDRWGHVSDCFREGAPPNAKPCVVLWPEF